MKNTGPRCEALYDPCASNACLNSGTCVRNFGIYPYYQCRCMSGYYGSNCEFMGSNPSGKVMPQYDTCVDSDTDLCPSYATQYLCFNRYLIKTVPVPIYCRKSCGNCRGIVDNNSNTNGTSITCTDRQSSCLAWSAMNKCSSLASMIPHPCRKSCKLC